MSSAQLKSKTFSKQSGQGILEVIITIAIGTIMILALVVLSVRSNRSSDFSKLNSQADALANEGIEMIKNIRATNAPGGLNHYCETSPFDSTQDLSSESTCSGAAENWINNTTAQKTKSWSDFFAMVDLQDQKPSGVGATDWRYNSVFGHYSGYGYQAHFHTYVASGGITAINEPLSSYSCFGGPPCNIQEKLGPGATPPQDFYAGCGTQLSGCIDLHHDFGGILVGARVFRRILFIADTPTNFPSGCDNSPANQCGKSHCNSTTGWVGTPTDWKQIKQFTVEVSWEDTSGHHAVTKSTCLTA